ncbi:transposase [Phnomibacter sp. MR]|uniref:transposase n=1 Tax=Phnomibacter sp. MR TaxID=3042318 RepID=UPI003A7F9427
MEAVARRVELQQVTVYGFVIMPNHLHVIWQLHNGINRADFQRDFLKFTARSLLYFMQMNEDPLLTSLQVKAADRQQQVWERNSLSIDLYSEEVFLQKLNYIHNNPIQPKWNLAKWPGNYLWSSAGFYETGVSPFSFLKHYRS